MSSLSAESSAPGGLTPAVRWLLILNVAVYFLEQTIVSPLAVNRLFAFSMDSVLGAQRWWTFVTYAFLHGGLLHIAMNMLAIWQFGPRVEQLYGTNRFVRFYIFCALGAAVLHAMIPGSGAGLIGASGAVFGVMYAFAHAWPRTQIALFGIVPMPVKLFVVGYAAIELFNGISGSGGNVAHWAHLGGFVTAWILVRLPSAPKLESWQERFSRAPELPDDDLQRVAPRGRAPKFAERDAADDAVARSNAIVQRRQPVTPVAVPPAPVAPKVDVRAPRTARQVAQEELDLLLDKISAEGISSLSAGESERLAELSRVIREG
jgi:membrane associated rhomboid family serine protease